MGRYRVLGLALVMMAAAMGAGCGGGTTSSGGFEVAITAQELQNVGSLCAVKGNATNAGNVTAQVDLTYDAKNAAGAVIGTSTASFQVSGFSNFEFSNSKGNNLGQPSSTVFSNGLSCSAISSFERTRTDVKKA
jgi:hypothetical protein